MPEIISVGNSNGLDTGSLKPCSLSFCLIYCKHCLDSAKTSRHNSPQATTQGSVKRHLRKLTMKLLRKPSWAQIGKPMNASSCTKVTKAKGKDVMLTSTTGSGKTLAFLLPLLSPKMSQAKLQVLLVPLTASPPRLERFILPLAKTGLSRRTTWSR